MNSKSGYVDIEFEGKIYPCKFGLNAFYLATEKHSIKLSELDNFTNVNKLLWFRDIIWAGIKSAAIARNLEHQDITPEFVGEMIDEFDETQIESINNAITNARLMGKQINSFSSKKK